MTTICEPDQHDLHRLLDSVPDTREIVVRRGDEDDVLRAAWRSAREDAITRWLAWSRNPSRDLWTSYVAAHDREDAAIAALAGGAGRVSSARGLTGAISGSP